MENTPPWAMPAGGATDGGGLTSIGDGQTTGNCGAQSRGAVAAVAAMLAGLRSSKARETV